MRVGSAVAAACGLYGEEPKKESGKEAVKAMMAKLHKGDKSPLARSRRGGEGKPDWDQLDE